MSDVTVLYFAALKDLVGRSEEQLALPAASTTTVQSLLLLLSERHTGLAARLGSVRVAVNETFVDLATQIAPGDVVALIPPVSGG